MSKVGLPGQGGGTRSSGTSGRRTAADEGGSEATGDKGEAASRGCGRRSHTGRAAVVGEAAHEEVGDGSSWLEPGWRRIGGGLRRAGGGGPRGCKAAGAGLQRTPAKTEGTSSAGLLLARRTTDEGAGARGAPLLERSADKDLAKRHGWDADGKGDAEVVDAPTRGVGLEEVDEGKERAARLWGSRRAAGGWREEEMGIEGERRHRVEEMGIGLLAALERSSRGSRTY